MTHDERRQGPATVINRSVPLMRYTSLVLARKLYEAMIARLPEEVRP